MSSWNVEDPGFLASNNTILVTQTESLNFTQSRAHLHSNLVWGVLYALYGPTVSPSSLLSDDVVTVGRDPGCTIVVQDDRVSKLHFRISRKATDVVHHQPVSDHEKQVEESDETPPYTPPTGREEDLKYRIKFILEDCSTNGTFINGKRVPSRTRYELVSGDEIDLVMCKIAQGKRRRDDRQLLPSTLSDKGDLPIGEPKRDFVIAFLFQDFSQRASRREECLFSHQLQVPEKRFPWQWGPEIGHGGNAVVYEGINEETGARIAVKRLNVPIRRKTASEESSRSESRSPPLITATVKIARRESSAMDPFVGLNEEHKKELSLMKSLHHKRIVQYHGFEVDEDNHVCILLEYISGGSLLQVLHRFGAFCLNVVRLYALQVLQGLEYLHFRSVVHGDIKPANILLTDKGEIKLSDFGTSRIVGNDEVEPSALMGSPPWMSPEMIRNGKATLASDIWSFGCVVLEMATGRPPWSEDPQVFPPQSQSQTPRHPAQVMWYIGQGSKRPSLEGLDRLDESSPALKQLIELCLSLDPSKRPLASELLGHPFILGTATSVRSPREVAPDEQSQSQLFQHMNFVRGCSAPPPSSQGIPVPFGAPQGHLLESGTGLTEKMRGLEPLRETF